MKDRSFRNTVIEVEGEIMTARVRHRTRREVARRRDMDRREQREFARDREYA